MQYSWIGENVAPSRVRRAACAWAVLLSVMTSGARAGADELVVPTPPAAYAEDDAPPLPDPPPPPATPLAPAPAPGARTAVHSLFAEALGAGLPWSVNYERMALGELGIRVGVSYVQRERDGAVRSQLAFPLVFSYTGARTPSGHGLDVGAGVVLGRGRGGEGPEGVEFFGDGDGFDAWGVLSAGYRAQRPRGGAYLRAGVDMLVLPARFRDGAMVPWFHASIGGSFGARRAAAHSEATPPVSGSGGSS